MKWNDRIQFLFDLILFIRFVWSEIAHFAAWWRHTDINTREKLKELIQLNQFEFVGGGWAQVIKSFNFFDTFYFYMRSDYTFLSISFSLISIE
jgi:hypothetical protein